MPVVDTSEVAIPPDQQMLAGLGADVRLAIRTLGRQPWSTLSMAATLALGIGAATAIYAVFNYVLFRPVPGVPSQSPLITVLFQPPNRSASAYGNAAALPAMREAASGLEYLADSQPETVAVAAPADTDPTFEDAEFVSSQLFRALGVSARIGRLFTDDEADNGSQNLAVISERLWRAGFGGSPDALGRTLTVNGRPFVVVGVVNRYGGWGSTRVGHTDLWVPVGTIRAVTGHAATTFGNLIGRMRAGASLELIGQQLQSAYERVARTLPPRYQAFVPIVYPGLYSFGADYARRQGLPLYWALMTATALLLVLACANAANMLLARASRREHETAVRLAIGASRWRVTRQFLIESIGLAALAGGLGLVAAVLLTATLRGVRLFEFFPDLQDIEIDARVLGFSVLVTAATVLAFGLTPALLASRADVRRVVGRTQRTVVSPHRLRNGLVIAQVALSLTLVAGAGVLNRSLRNLYATDLGMDLDHVLDLSLKPDQLGYDSARSARVVTDAVDGLRLAGFRDVAVSYPDPLAGGAGTISVRTQAMAQAEQRHPVDSSVSADYFRVLHIPLLAGRPFTDAECRESPQVDPMPVILNATLAADLFGREPPVGRTFELERYVGMATLSSTALVVGIAGDTRSSAVRGQPQAALYHARQPAWRYGHILVRAGEPDGVAIERIRRVIREVDPALPITSLRPLRDEVAEALSTDRVLARLSGLVAFFAAVLAAAGVVSLISQLVTERVRDFGIRRALGATDADIVSGLLKGVLVQATLGIVLGFGVYLGTARWLGTRLFGLGPLDPGTIAAAAATLVAIALVAAFLPARLACRIDPAAALRAE